jgi:hypothetical protein
MLFSGLFILSKNHTTKFISLIENLGNVIDNFEVWKNMTIFVMFIFVIYDFLRANKKYQVSKRA